MQPDPQKTLFEAAESKRLRDEGLLKVSSFPNDQWVKVARDFVVLHAKQFGQVSCEDVHLHIPLPTGMHPNAMGCVFSNQPKLQLLRYVNSVRKAAHARRIAVYGYREPL